MEYQEKSSSRRVRFGKLSLVNKLAIILIVELIIIDLTLIPVILQNMARDQQRQEAVTHKSELHPTIEPSLTPSPTITPTITKAEKPSIAPKMTSTPIPTKANLPPPTSAPPPTSTLYPTATPAPSGDTTRPAVQITNMLDGATYSTNYVCLSLTASDNVTPVDKLLTRFKWGEGSWTGSHNVFTDCKSMQNGTHAVFVEVKDEAGNSEVQSRIFTVQTN